MTLVSNVFLTHGLMLLCACAATYAALPESTGRIVPELQKAYDCLGAAAALIGLSLIEIALAAIGPADQPTMELGLTVIASFLVGRSAAVLLRSRQEPQSDLHDSPAPPAAEG